MWEDPGNVDGGRWLFILDKKHRQQDLDNYWLDLVSIIIHYLNIFHGRAPRSIFVHKVKISAFEF